MKINLITSLSGYPYGTATAKRIKLVGKSIQASGVEFRIYTNCLQFNEFNTDTVGNHENIPFEYLHGKKLNKELSKLQKVRYFLLGCIKLVSLFRLFDKKNDIVYSYNLGNLFNVYVILLCKLFKIRIVQEINEWYHNDLNRKLEKFIMEGPLVKYSNAAIVISDEIESKVLKINPEIHLLKIPILEEFLDVPIKSAKIDMKEKYCFWMGDVNAYIEDVLFIVKACAKLYNSGLSIKAYFSGPYSKAASDQIKAVASQHNCPIENIKMLGFISEEELDYYCNNAYLCVVPLWDDERSKSRFPTKIASFMQVRKPIISCKIGEVANLLTDSVNILFYKEGDYHDLAEKIRELLMDPQLYSTIAENSYDFANRNFNYLNYSTKLKLLLNKLSA